VTRKSIDTDRQVRTVADALGIRARSDLRRAITKAAVARVEGWMRDLSIEPRSLDDVHQLVLNQTRVEIIRVESDGELEDVSRKYRTRYPALPVQLELELGDSTEALVFRKQPDRRSSAFLAVVDARGDRRHRAWFAERHEPAHLLVEDPGAQVVFRRTHQSRAQPIEQVVDSVASAVGFWEPIVRPSFEAALRKHANLLDAIDELRFVVAPNASFEATARAAIQLLPDPVAVLYTDYDCRADDRDLPETRLRSLALRAKSVMINDAADRMGLRIWLNYRIPESSVISVARRAATEHVLTEIDDLGHWTTESGRGLKALPVRVSAKRCWSTLELAR
jgi:hypothetical protein